MDTAARIAALHRIYQMDSAQIVPLNMERERNWFDWLRAIDAMIAGGPFPPGYTAEHALREVIAAIRRGIREQKRNPGALKFSNLIGAVDSFESELSLVRSASVLASKLRPPSSVVVRTVSQHGTTERRVANTDPGKAVPISEVIAAMRAAAEAAPAPSIQKRHLGFIR